MKIWRSSRRTGEERIKFFADAYHSDYTQKATVSLRAFPRHRILNMKRNDQSLPQDAQILANLYCNKATNRRSDNCCSQHASTP